MQPELADIKIGDPAVLSCGTSEKHGRHTDSGASMSKPWAICKPYVSHMLLYAQVAPAFAKHKELPGPDLKELCCNLREVLEMKGWTLS